MAVKWTRRPPRRHEVGVVASRLTFGPGIGDFKEFVYALISLGRPRPGGRSARPGEVRKAEDAEGNQHHRVVNRRDDGHCHQLIVSCGPPSLTIMIIIRPHGSSHGSAFPPPWF